MHPYRQFVEADKTIPSFSGWSKPEAETSYVWFDVPLAINGVVEAAFVLHGGCYADRPDVNVTFELRVSRRPGRQCIPLIRGCWRSLRGGHSNDRRYGPPWGGKDVPATHLHPFDINWAERRQRMVGANLPLATPISEPVERIEDFQQFIGKAMRINNIELVHLPPWEYRLL